MMEINRSLTDCVDPRREMAARKVADDAAAAKDAQQQQLERMRKSLKEAAEKIQNQSASKIAEAVSGKNGGRQIGLMTVGGTTRNSTSQASKAKARAIRQKMKRGKKLSGDEMKYLRDNDPAAYRKAKAAQEAREQLERDLKHCQSKAEVRQAMVRASLKVAAQAEAANSDVGGATPAPAAGAGGGESVAVSGDATATPAAVNAESVAVDAEAGATASANAPAASSVNAEAPAVNANGSAPAETPRLKLNLATPLAAEMEATSLSAGEVNADGDDAGADGVEGTADDGKDSSGNATISNADISAMPTGTADVDDLPPTVLLIIRALQDEYNEFVNSKRYEKLPDDLLTLEDAKQARRAQQADERAKATPATPAHALEAYFAAMNLSDTLANE